VILRNAFVAGDMKTDGTSVKSDVKLRRGVNVKGQVVGVDGKLLENASMISPLMPRSELGRLGLQVNATPGESRRAFTALRYSAIHGIVSDAKSVAERYRWEDALRAACRLPALRELWVENTTATDFAVEDIRNLKKLEKLVLNQKDITARPLRHVGEMTELRDLKLGKPPLRDEDMTFLRRLTKLERLMLPSRTELTDNCRQTLTAW
jgi:hypothetical protein